MPHKYLLEVAVAGKEKPHASFESPNPFGHFATGDSLVLIGEGGRLVTSEIAEVEHTVWMDKRGPAHKVRIYTR